jgi:DNA-binding beta-propeller fold protein YncE
MSGRATALLLLVLLAACNPARLLQGGGLGASASNQQTTPASFRIIRDVPLTGGTSRFDYQSLDPQAHRLYIAHLGAGLVTVFDTQTSAVVGDVLNVPGVHGVLAVPELGRVYATATDANQLVAIDPGALTILATAPTGDYPDGLTYAPTVGKVYTSNEHGRSDTAVDVRTHQAVATIALGGEVGNTQFDSASGLVYAGVHQRNELVAIDPRSDQVAGRSALPGCEDPHGLYIDAATRRAFVGCEGNAKLLVVDMATMQVTSEHAVGQTPDVLAYDPVPGWLYVAAEDGVLTVLAVNEGAVREVAKGMAGPNAHSVAVNPETHHIYLPLMNVDGRPVLREMAVELSSGG